MLITITTLVLIVFFVLLIAPLKIAAVYENGAFKLNVFLYGLKVFSLKKRNKLSTEKAAKKAEKFEKDTNSLSLKLTDIIKIFKITLRLLKRYVSMESISFNIRVGTGNAAITAISTGSLWAAVYGLLGIIGRIVYIKNHTVNIVPDYQNDVFEAEGKCIITSRVVYIIIIAIIILFNIRRSKK